MNNVQLIMIAIAVFPFFTWVTILSMFGFSTLDSAGDGQSPSFVNEATERQSQSANEDVDLYFARLLIHSPYIYT